MTSEMEMIRQFNSELSSIYENKPPISKAKMASITRSAVKGLKYYKHIVHSVEKFLQKCRAEYKIAGLYVLDSIIRQSRHQFGVDKDLFGPRFQKNIKLTFQSIYQCPSEDKPKVVRVLNLWQKNGIFAAKVIQPLLDMASLSAHALASAVHEQKKKTKGAPESNTFEETDAAFDNLPGSMDASESLENNLGINQEDASAATAAGTSLQDVSQKRLTQDEEIQRLKLQLEQQQKQQELLQQQLQLQIMATKQQALQMQLQQQQMQQRLQEQLQQQSLKSIQQLIQPALQGGQEGALLTQIEDLTSQLEKDKAAVASFDIAQRQAASKPGNGKVNAGGAIETQAQFLENFQQLIQTAKGIIQKDPRQNGGQPSATTTEVGMKLQSSPKFKEALLDAFDHYDDEEESDEQRIAAQRRRLEEEQSRLDTRPNDLEKIKDYRLQQQQQLHVKTAPGSGGTVVADPRGHHLQQSHAQHPFPADDDDAMQIEDDEDEFYEPTEPLINNNNKRKTSGTWLAPASEASDPRNDNFNAEEKRRRLSNDTPFREDVDSNLDRGRSSHRDPSLVGQDMQPPYGHKWNERASIAQSENSMAEPNCQMDEREKRALPPTRENRLSVVSVTLWVGRLPKSTHPDAIAGVLGAYGKVENIDMIDMRGCAFVTMKSRYDAERTLRYMKGERINGADIKITWGQGKGMQDFAKFWDADLGCAYIPWGAFEERHLRPLMEGCIIDERTLPPGMSLPRAPLPVDQPRLPFPIPRSTSTEVRPLLPLHMPPPPIGVPMPGLPHRAPLLPGIPPPGLLPPNFRPTLSSQPPLAGLSGLLPLNRGSLLGLPPGLPPRGVPPVKQDSESTPEQEPSEPVFQGLRFGIRPLLDGSRPPHGLAFDPSRPPFPTAPGGLPPIFQRPPFDVRGLNASLPPAFDPSQPPPPPPWLAGKVFEQPPVVQKLSEEDQSAMSTEQDDIERMIEDAKRETRAESSERKGLESRGREEVQETRERPKIERDERDRRRDRDPDRERDRDPNRERDRDPDRERDREPDRGRDRETDRERVRDRSRDFDRRDRRDRDERDGRKDDRVDRRERRSERDRREREDREPRREERGVRDRFGREADRGFRERDDERFGRDRDEDRFARDRDRDRNRDYDSDRSKRDARDSRGGRNENEQERASGGRDRSSDRDRKAHQRDGEDVDVATDHGSVLLQSHSPGTQFQPVARRDYSGERSSSGFKSTFAEVRVADPQASVIDALEKGDKDEVDIGNRTSTRKKARESNSKPMFVPFAMNPYHIDRDEGASEDDVSSDVKARLPVEKSSEDKPVKRASWNNVEPPSSASVSDTMQSAGPGADSRPFSGLALKLPYQKVIVDHAFDSVLEKTVAPPPFVPRSLHAEKEQEKMSNRTSKESKSSHACEPTVAAIAVKKASDDEPEPSSSLDSHAFISSTSEGRIERVSAAHDSSVTSRSLTGPAEDQPEMLADETVTNKSDMQEATPGDPSSLLYSPQLSYSTVVEGAASPASGAQVEGSSEHDQSADEG